MIKFTENVSTNTRLNNLFKRGLRVSYFLKYENNIVSIANLKERNTCNRQITMPIKEKDLTLRKIQEIVPKYETLIEAEGFGIKFANILQEALINAGLPGIPEFNKNDKFTLKCTCDKNKVIKLIQIAKQMGIEITLI